MDQSQIRNFCIIAHIDHGKSTLADRFLEITGTVEKRKLKEQTLDTMDLERERGITIKLQPVRMEWRGYILNLIDTPGHVDFTYEVSRSLQACEGAILLVDATQGIQAQTLANYNLAREQKLKIISVINKIDLPQAETEKTRQDLAKLLAIAPLEILTCSAKKGIGIAEVLEKVIADVPAPQGEPHAPLRALIFDSFYNTFLGVVAMVRVVDGQCQTGQKIKMLGTQAAAEAIELGHFRPQLIKKDSLSAGEVGYIATGLKEVSLCRVGDTLTLEDTPGISSLPGYKDIQPMVFSQIFCVDNAEYSKLKDSLAKLKLNDASLSYEPINSPALGFGFRCGFLGLLHMDIVQERLQREFDLNIILTSPTVNYRVHLKNQETRLIHNPSEFPDPAQVDYVEEPYVFLDVITPTRYLGPIMELLQKRRGEYRDQKYLTEALVILSYYVPLSKIILDFYDRLKSVSAGYASLHYSLAGFQKTEIVQLDILIAGEKVEALSLFAYPEEAPFLSKMIVKRLKTIVPKQMFEVPLQAAIGGKIIARETIRAFRKDVTAKLYGGDRTRKDKLLEKQKKGKKKMKMVGRVALPPETFLAFLRRD